MLAQPLKTDMFSKGFLERINEAESELGAIGTLQKQIDEKSRNLAEIWVSVLRQVDLSVPVRKESFGILFGNVEKAVLEPAGMVTLKISGNDVSYPLVELPSDTITSIVSNSAPELLKLFRDMVKLGTASVDALERMALDFDESMGVQTRRVPEASAIPRADACELPVQSAQNVQKPRPAAKKRNPFAAAADHYDFKGSFGAPKEEPFNSVSFSQNISI